MPYWDPFETMRRLQEEMNTSFDEFFGRYYRRPLLPGVGESYPLVREPLADMIDEGDKLRVIMELPGVEKDDVEVEVERNSLVVKAEVKAKEEKKGKGYYYQERRYSHFQRSFTLPTEVIPEKTEAKLKNGILELTLTKLKPSPKKKKRKIEIH